MVRGSLDLTGRVTIITGASAGIGAAAARAFAAAGAEVVLAARNGDELATVAQSLPREPLIAPTDVTDRVAVQSLVERTVERHGRIDILINNAGVGLTGPIGRLATDDLERTLAVDLFGPLHLVQAALPYMRPRPPSSLAPQIIQISSVVALRALPYLGGYAAAKAALERMSEALRVELRERRIVVTVVRPGTTATGFRQHRLGSGSDRRRIAPRGVPADRVAAVLVNAARRQPRVAYTSWGDRLMVYGSLLLPPLTDRLLQRMIEWREERP